MIQLTWLTASAVLGSVIAHHQNWGNYLIWVHSPHGGRLDQPLLDASMSPPANSTGPARPATKPARPVTETARSTDGSTTPAVPEHRVLLNGLFRQVLGSNFASSGLNDLAFLSAVTTPPLSRLSIDSRQKSYSTVTAQGSYVLRQYIQPPPLSSGASLDYFQ